MAHGAGSTFPYWADHIVFIPGNETPERGDVRGAYIEGLNCIRYVCHTRFCYRRMALQIKDKVL